MKMTKLLALLHSPLLTVAPALAEYLKEIG